MPHGSKLKVYNIIHQKRGGLAFLKLMRMVNVILISNSFSVLVLIIFIIGSFIKKPISPGE
jgi:hypothetical protein